MSWDIFVQDIPRTVRSVEEIPADFEPQCIGTRAGIIAKICQLVPATDVSDPAWLQINEDDFSIEVNLGDDGPLAGFVFHVRGGDASAYVIHDILEHLKLRALDPSSKTGIFSLEGGSLEGLQRWREYRESVLSSRDT